MSERPLIELCGLTRRDRRSGRPLLDRVSFQIYPGDRIGLIGPSGSGKTTLLRALAKLDPVDQGELRFRGQPVAGDRVPGYRSQVVLLTQSPAFGSGSVRADLARPHELAGSDRRLDVDHVLAWLGRLGRPASMLDQSVASLSGGERQMVALIRAMSLAPLVLLLDEPTAAIDDGTTGTFEALVREWQGAAPQRALVWTSHDADQVRRMTTRCLTVADGQLIAETGGR